MIFWVICGATLGAPPTLFGRFLDELPRTPFIRSSQSAPWTNFRLCEVAHLDQRPRSARHGSGAWATGCFQTHVSSITPPVYTAHRGRARVRGEALAGLFCDDRTVRAKAITTQTPYLDSCSDRRSPKCRSLSTRRGILGDEPTFASITLIMDPCNLQEETNR
jgi:hypothetical protein